MQTATTRIRRSTGLQIVQRARGNGIPGLFCEELQHYVAGFVALIVGNEGAGLSASLVAQATQRVTIPMPGRVESLNAAAAAAVCLFECVRQRAVRNDVIA